MRLPPLSWTETSGETLPSRNRPISSGFWEYLRTWHLIGPGLHKQTKGVKHKEKILMMMKEKRVERVTERMEESNQHQTMKTKQQRGRHPDLRNFPSPRKDQAALRELD